MRGVDSSLAGVGSKLLAEDETHLNLLPHVRASWTLRTARPQIPTPGTNRQVTVFGALEVTTGRWVYRLGRRCAADFIALLDQLLRAFPQAPVIAVICDNDSIHHAPQGHRLPGGAPSPGATVRRPVQPERQSRRTDLGRAEELHREHCGDPARPAPPDLLLLPRPLTRSDARYRRALVPPGYEQNSWNTALGLDSHEWPISLP